MLPRWTRLLPAAAALLLAAAPAAADPLRLVPKQAGTAVVVENPRKLVETLRNLDAYQSAGALPQVREVLDSTTARRFFQLVEYYEQALGAKWPDLLDKLAGGGLVVGVAIADDPAPALMVIEGTDEAATAEFFRLAADLLDQETTRQAVGDAPAQKVRRAKRGNAETVHLGDDFHAARVGSVLYVANKEDALNAGLDLKPGQSLADVPGPKAARKLLGGDPLAWVWNDFAQVKEGEAAKNFFAATRKDILQTLVLGSSIDAVRRADFIAAGLYRTADGLRLVMRLPAKRADLAADLGPLHAPAAGQPGSLPLLEPKGVVYSQSFYLDLGHLWKDRKAIFNEQNLKDVEQAEKDVSKVIPGPALGKILEMSGPHHRFVAVQYDTLPYSVAPDQRLPAFALVSSMRDPQFGKSASSALRAAALLATFQAGLKMSEEKYDGVQIVSYKFPEKGKLDADAENLRFNFVPSFAVVDNFLVVASRPELVKDLMPELRKPGKSSLVVWRGRLYGAGAADVVRGLPDPLVTDAILDQGVGLDEAKKQVEELAKWAATLGSASLEIDHQADAYQVQIEWKTKK